MATQGPTATTGATPAVMTSRLTQMQMRFQQRQQQERDQRKVEMISTTATKATSVAASSHQQQNGAGSSSTIRSSAISAYSTTTTTSSSTIAAAIGGDLSASLGAGKVRQMFDERRHHRVAGIDKSYPLQPIQPQQQQQQTGKAVTNGGSNVSNGNHTGKSSSGGGGATTGLNNKTRVPPISASTKARLALQQQRQQQQQQQQQENGNYGETLKSATFDDNENLLDDEKFPDTISFDEDLTITPSPIARKLPNVGKLNGQQQNVNSLKLKPVPGRTPSTTVTTAKSATKKTSPVNSAAATGATAAAAAQSSPSSSPSPTATPRSNSQANSAKSAASRASTGKFAMASTSAISRKPSATSAPSPPIPDGPVPDGLARCTICGRNFAEDRIAKHREICQKTKSKKRKVFDTTKHRVLGTDAEKYVLKKKVGAGASKKSISGGSTTKAATAAAAAAEAKKSDWRRKHEEFIQAIRAAKEMQAHLAKGGKLSDLPPPPPSENPDYVQCPHCSRRFNQTAAERHIPKCATMKHNKPKPKPTTKRF